MPCSCCCGVFFIYRHHAERGGSDGGPLRPQEVVCFCHSWWVVCLIRLIVEMYLMLVVLVYRSSATNRIITAKDHASVQINIGHVDENGLYDGRFTTFALSGFIRAQVIIIVNFCLFTCAWISLCELSHCCIALFPAWSWIMRALCCCWQLIMSLNFSAVNTQAESLIGCFVDCFYAMHWRSVLLARAFYIFIWLIWFISFDTKSVHTLFFFMFCVVFGTVTNLPKWWQCKKSY